jgi:hypothetical protein
MPEMGGYYRAIREVRPGEPDSVIRGRGMDGEIYLFARVHAHTRTMDGFADGGLKWLHIVFIRFLSFFSIPGHCPSRIGVGFFLDMMGSP